MFSNKRIKYCDYKEMVSILKIVKNQCPHIYFRAKTKEECFKCDAYIEQSKTKLKVSFCLGLKPCSYVLKLDSEEVNQQITGCEAYRILRKYYKEDKIEDAQCYGSAKQTLYKNDKYDGIRTKAYGYDMNSAFAKFMLEPIPDIRTMKYHTYIGEGQIGFDERADGRMIASFKEGNYCDYVCDLMESPYDRFVAHWYEIKKNAKDRNERNKAKGVLNYCIGYLQNTNPFIRCCIIQRCNDYIKSMIDENTIYANTDSIVSAIRRPDIEANIGNEVGMWKFEHNGEEFAWQKGSYNYQWNFDIPSYRGIPKGWFKTYNKENHTKWDILKDKAPVEGNIYKLNEEKLRLEKIKYEKKEKKI